MGWGTLPIIQKVSGFALVSCPSSLPQIPRAPQAHVAVSIGESLGPVSVLLVLVPEGAMHGSLLPLRTPQPPCSESLSSPANHLLRSRVNS